MKELIVRSSSGLIGLALIIAITIRGGPLLSTLVFLLSIVGLYEFYRALIAMDYKPVKIVGYMFTLLLYLKNLFFYNLSIEFMLAITTALLLISFVFSNKIYLENIIITIFSIIYVPFFLNHIVYLDKSEYIWIIYMIAWGTDTFAYIFGNLFGKRKLSPDISPNKTVAGAVGGILGSVLLMLIFAAITKQGHISSFTILGMLVSIMAQLGDLVASKLKRIANIKDYGKIIPGHGGVLDRFDSILFTAPAVYYYVKYFFV